MVQSSSIDVMRLPTFLVFWSGRMVSLFGYMLFSMATTWYVLDRTESALDTAIVLVIPMLCSLVIFQQRHLGRDGKPLGVCRPCGRRCFGRVDSPCKRRSGGRWLVSAVRAVACRHPDSATVQQGASWRLGVHQGQTGWTSLYRAASGRSHVWFVRR